MTNFCWFFFKWGAAVLVVAALAASPFFYRRVFFHVEEQVRARVEAEIAERFPQLEVRVRAARLAEGGIEIRGVSLLEPDVAGPQPELAYLDEVFIECSTNLKELASGDPRITGIKLIRPVLRATRRPEGCFSLEKLVPAKSSAPLPACTIENGAVEVFDPLKNPSSTFALRDIQLSLRPIHREGEKPGLLELRGYLMGDHVERVEVIGQVDPVAGRWSLSGTIDRLEISPELRAALPEPISRPMEKLAGVRAPANLSFQLASDGPGASVRFVVNGHIAGGRVEHPLLPYPLTDLKAGIHCDNGGFRIHDLTAEHGQTVWNVSHFEQRGYAADSPFVLKGGGRRVHVDRAWRDALPAEWQKYWTNYEPEGDIDLDGSLVFDGRQRTPSVRVTALNNASFCCYKFPYRLERGRGTVTLEGRELKVDLVAYSGAQPVNLKGTFYDPGPQYTGNIEVWGEKIQFDETLFKAILSEKSRNTIRSLHPQGTFDFHTRLWRAPNDPLPRPRIHQHLRVALNRCKVEYEKLPYPLDNLQGRLEMRDGQWATESHLTGTNDTGVVTISGQLTSAPEKDLLTLHFDADNVPLEEELRDALPPAQQQIWHALRPRGNVDFVADVVYDSRVRKPAIDLWLVPHGCPLPVQRQLAQSQAVPSGAALHAEVQKPAIDPAAPPVDDDSSIGTAIAPVAFPYRMERLSGLMHYRDGHVDLQNIQARHRGTTMRSDGTCDFLPDGSWRLRLDRMSVDRIRLHGEDHELLAALPEALRRAVTELRPSGPIYLKGMLEFFKRAPGTPLQTKWDVDLFLQQATLQAGPRLDNVFGSVRLQGAAEGSRYHSFGELELDSLTYKNFQFTDVLGPLYFDNRAVYLGTHPTALASGGKNTRVTAKVFGGVVAADCQVQLGQVPQYRLIAALSGADLKQFAAENLTNHQHLNGKVMGNVDLAGSRGQHTLVGRGNIHLTDANVYELPLMVALLKIVRAKPPDATAFTESDVAFKINGQHVLLEKIDLHGDALSLSGRGELTLDGQTNPIKLELHTSVGRNAIPLISGVFSEASQQIMKVHVDGTLDHPNTWTEAFPMASEALGLSRSDAPPAAPSGNRPWPFGARR
ncbi:MAG: AsmA-like C-terminal domain-containing protein [Pirellulales bacterium]